MVWDFDSGSMSIEPEKPLQIVKKRSILVPYQLYLPCEEAIMATRTITKKAELKTSTAKPATEKEAPAKKTVTKKVTEKAATVKKTAVRKTSSRKTVSLNTEVYVQWLGKEVYERDIIENIKKVWTEEMGKKESELVDLKIYIKPEDNGAHYVINGDITGFIEL